MNQIPSSYQIHFVTLAMALSTYQTSNVKICHVETMEIFYQTYFRGTELLQL
jgi:hypothetical protein